MLYKTDSYLALHSELSVYLTFTIVLKSKFMPNTKPTSCKFKTLHTGHLF